MEVHVQLDTCGPEDDDLRDEDAWKKLVSW
jgi:hypothetical protein